VYAIAHAHTSVHGAAKALGQFSQVIEEESAVFICEETGRTIVASLNDVPSDAGKAQARATRRAVQGDSGEVARNSAARAHSSPGTGLVIRKEPRLYFLYSSHYQTPLHVLPTFQWRIWNVNSDGARWM
jgi:hypothetical protein